MICYKKTLQTLTTSLFAVILSVWVLWIWIGYEPIPNLVKLTPGLTFDYIIVGAGTAGSVLANRLGINSNLSVLLIEAGETFGPLVKIPLLATVAQKTKNDWAFKSTPQKYSSRGLIDNKQCIPRGKGLGGSSQINYLLHFSGSHRDFDRWESKGAIGWDSDIMSRYTTLSQDQTSSCSLDSEGVCVLQNELSNQTEIVDDIWKMPENYSKITEAFLRAGEEFTGQKLRFALSQYNIRNGVRWSTYQKYLRPTFKFSNVKIMTNAIVEKIHVLNRKAKSVRVIDGETDQAIEIHARNEIILSAGAYSTPLILQSSGIGPKSLLDKLKIPTVVDSPQVGKNLHDHLNLPLFVSINVSASLTLDKILSLKEVASYLITGGGHFSNFGVIGHISSNMDDYGVTIVATGAIDEDALKALSNFQQDAFRSLFPLYYNSSQEGFLLLTTCLQPESRGSVRLKSKNIRDDPIIDPNFLHNPGDVDCMIRGVRLAVKFAMSEAFQDIGARIHWPKLKQCRNFGPFPRDFITNEPSNLYLECIMRHVALTSHHPGGTCAMGLRNESPLDHRLRVKGISGLRVVDASVFPTPVSGVPNSVLVAVAKRAAKMIRQEH